MKKTKKERKPSRLFHRQALVLQKDATLNLPVTYRQLFKFTYKTNFTLLLKCSIMITLFALPLLACLYIRGVISSGLANNTNTDEAVKNIMALNSWFGFVFLGGFLITSLGIVGVFNVLKRFIKNEGVKFNRDFLDGIRKNWLQTLLTTLFYFGILAVLNYFMNLFSFKSNFPYYGVMLVVFIILQILMFMAYIMNIMSIIIYKCPFFKNIKNMFLVMFSRLPYCLLALVCGVGPFILVWAIGYVPVLFGFLIIYICLGFGHSALLTAITTIYNFDECINKRQFPDRYREGLFEGEQVQPIDEGFHK